MRATRVALLAGVIGLVALASVAFGQEVSPMLRAAVSPRIRHCAEGPAVQSAPLAVWRYYGGELDQVIWTSAWNPTPLFTVELSGRSWIGGSLIRINFS